LEKKEQLIFMSKDVKMLNIGECFGEISLIENRPRQATVTAVTDCHLAVLYKKDFDEILSIFVVINDIFF